MSDDTEKDPVTGLLQRAAFLEKVRKAESVDAAKVRRGCLLILTFPVLSKIQDSAGKEQADLALRNLLGVVETRLRSRDTIGRIRAHSLCILLRQCSESDAVQIAEHYMNLLRNAELLAGDQRAAMDLHYRIIPLDWPGRRRRQGMSRTIKTLVDHALVESTVHTLASPGMRERGKLLRLPGQRQALEPAVQAPVTNLTTQPVTGETCRLMPGLLLKHQPLVCCYRVRRVGVHLPQQPIEQCTLFDQVLGALALPTGQARPLIESQLVMPVDAAQLSWESVTWLKQQCEERRVAPSDVCLSLHLDSVSQNLRSSLPVLRRLNRHGIRLMLEGVSSAAQYDALLKLVAFDCLLISARVLQASQVQVRSRQELEALLTLAHRKQREVYASGIDSQRTLAHARLLNIEIGFGRECGRSQPFPVPGGRQSV